MFLWLTSLALYFIQCLPAGEAEWGWHPRAQFLNPRNKTINFSFLTSSQPLKVSTLGYEQDTPYHIFMSVPDGLIENLRYLIYWKFGQQLDLS